MSDDEFTEDARGRWVCARCNFSFGRRSAHTPGGDRCKAFLEGHRMGEAGFVVVQADVAIWISAHMPLLLKYKKATFRQNEPIKTYAWAPEWLSKLYDAYRVRKLGHEHMMFSTADGEEYTDLALKKDTRDAKVVLEMAKRIEAAPDLQGAILAVAALDQEEGDAVWQMLEELIK